VFLAWPDPEDFYEPNSAVVLPGSSTYEDAGMTPTLLDCTWEPQGLPGLGLYKLSELMVPFEVQLRATSDAQRDVLISGMEELWVADGVLMDQLDGARYGLRLPLEGYWGVDAVFSLMGHTILDDATTAMQNERTVTFRLEGRAPQVVLRPVQPMKLTVKVCVDGEAV
jgi:hypothetical protein